MASITIEASKVARKSPIRVDSSLVGTVSGVEDVSVSLPSSKARLSVGKLGYKSNTITVEDGQSCPCYLAIFLNRFIAIAPLLLYLVGGRYLPLVAVLSTIILLFSLPFLKLEIVG
ncbi:MAG: hypothetical protein ACLRSA_01915 [Streptococcus salivarius]